MNMRIKPEEDRPLKSYYKGHSKFLTNEKALTLAGKLHQQHQLNSIDYDKQLMELIEIVKHVDKHCYNIFLDNNEESNLASIKENWTLSQSENMKNTITQQLCEDIHIVTLEAKEKEIIIKSVTDIIIDFVATGYALES